MLAAIAVPARGHGQQATPAHSLQQVEHLNAILATLCIAGMVRVPPPALPPPVAARPRHALLRALAVHERMQLTRLLHGLPLREAPALPGTEVVPATVAETVTGIAADAAALAGVFGGPPLPPPPALRSGATPADVVAALSVSDDLLDALGTPAVVPNDVVRQAMALQRGAEDLARQRGATPAAPEPVPPGRSPGEAFAEGIEAIRAMAALAARTPALAPPGGVRDLPVPQGPLSPRQVRDLALSAVADLAAIRLRAGGIPPLLAVPEQVGMTPTDVVLAMRAARAALQAI